MVILSDEARLIKNLTQRYESIGKASRPVVNSSRPVHVGLSLMLYQLINVDESEQFITLKLWLHLVGIYRRHSLTRFIAKQRQSRRETVSAYSRPLFKRPYYFNALIVRYKIRHRIFNRQQVKYPVGYMTGQILSSVKRAQPRRVKHPFL